MRKARRSDRLTLRDRLSHLTYVQVCKLLGPLGKQLLFEGGKERIDIVEQVVLGNDFFRLRLHEANLIITLKSEARQRLHWFCTTCYRPCVHAGAAFSLILEEKTALGLAAPPAEEVPLEKLGEAELVTRALKEREERAREERMIVQTSDEKTPWADYAVRSVASGRSYRVALRGFEKGDSYCSCPDFRTNSLGTCKHILHVERKVRRRFSPQMLKKPYVRRALSLHINYDVPLRLRFLAPNTLEPRIREVISPLDHKDEDDVRPFVKALVKLERLGVSVNVYPDAEEFIQKRLLLQRINIVADEIRRDPSNHPLRKTLLKIELLPYQLHGVAFAAAAGRAILADDMGLGKTIQGVGVAELLARETDLKRVLVICPATLKAQWRNEIHRFCARDCQIVFGGAVERARQYGSDCFFTICNYEQVMRDLIVIERVRWDFIILDEGQRIKNWQTKTASVIKALKSPFALVLTGTPLENRIDELYSIVEFVDDRRLAPAFRFFNRYRVTDENGRVIGYKNLDELRTRLAPILLRRTRESVMKELPPRTTEIVRITPTDEQQKLHDSFMKLVGLILNKPFLSEMDLLNLRKHLLGARLSMNSTALVTKQLPGCSSKLDAIAELLTRLIAEPNRKIVMFSEWTGMLDLLEPLLNQLKASFVRLDGSVPQTQRNQLVYRFQHDASCRVFLTTNAGSTGLNLQSADTVINVELPWNPAILEQRIGRAHRMGQKRPVHVYLFVSEGSIEEGLLATLASKHELFQAVLDPDSTVDELQMIGAVDDLKRRLEILLGAIPEAPIAVREVEDVHASLQSRSCRDDMARAGGELFSAVVQCISQWFQGGANESKPTREVEALKQRLTQCVDVDPDGRRRLTLVLPDERSISQFAEAFARLLALSGSHESTQPGNETDGRHQSS